MKKLFIGLLTLGCMSSFAQEVKCTEVNIELDNSLFLYYKVLDLPISDEVRDFYISNDETLSYTYNHNGTNIYSTFLLSKAQHRCLQLKAKVSFDKEDSTKLINLGYFGDGCVPARKNIKDFSFKYYLWVKGKGFLNIKDGRLFDRNIYINGMDLKCEIVDL